jgi:hypothetical protein
MVRLGCVALCTLLASLACGNETASGESTNEIGGASGAGGGANGAGGTPPSGGSSGIAGTAGTPGSGGAPGVDDDGDGLDDALEFSIASEHFPYLSLAPDDKCPRLGVLFRASPHPGDASKWMIWYVVLFERDCGLTAHVGDDEVFGVVLDPSLPAPASILAVRAISHQGTFCQRVTSCGSLPGCKPCTTASRDGKAFPVVFASVNKHGQYVEESSCDQNVVCDLGGCTLNPNPTRPPFVNAGEPDKPLVRDLTAQGFITADNGWTEQRLFGFDPWSGQDFGGAGNVADDLTDPAFVVPATGCN